MDWGGATQADDRRYRSAHPLSAEEIDEALAGGFGQ